MVKKKIIIGFSIFIILTILTSLTLIMLAPKLEEKRIKNAIEIANYCQVDSDCVNVGGKCPFGCYIYVNKNEVKQITQLIESYDSKCVYGCVSCSDVICKNSKCQEVCE